MSDPACAYCHGVQSCRVRLDRDDSPNILTMCLPCLRSVMLRKAASSAQRSVNLLQQDAEELGLQLWRSGNAVYLLPALAPSGPIANSLLVRR